MKQNKAKAELNWSKTTQNKPKRPKRRHKLSQNNLREPKWSKMQQNFCSMDKRLQIVELEA